MTSKPLLTSAALLLGAAFVLRAPALPRASQTAATEPFVSVPIGGIIMWWGRASEIPEGFEACDGTTVTTRDAVLRGAKPNLENRFPRGAPSFRSYIPTAFKGGGQDEFDIDQLASILADHQLTANQLPAHKHTLPSLKHTITGRPPKTPPNSLAHTHTVDPKGSPQGSHRHGMDHVHPGAPHDHGLLQGNGSDNSNAEALPAVLTENPAGNQVFGSTGDAREISPKKPFLTGPPEDSTGSPMLQTDRDVFTLPDLVVSTEGGTIDDHANEVTDSEGNTGTILLAHKLNAQLPKIDNRPAFLEVVFLIRVK